MFTRSLVKAFRGLIVITILGYCPSLSATCVETKATEIAKNQIEISFKNTGKWIRSGLKRLKSKGPKNYHDATVTFNSKLDRTERSCSYKARIRMVGDGLDHVNIDRNTSPQNFVSSMKIKLLDGNIFGATRFKLLLPRTRNSEKEIIGSEILKELGIIVPRTKMVSARIRGNDNSLSFIFQEAIEKELVENAGYTEGPLMEGNEFFLWGFGEKSFDHSVISYARLTNEKYAERSNPRFYLSALALTTLNRAYQDARRRRTNPLDFLGVGDFPILDGNLFNISLTVLNGHHGLFLNNRVFYYNPVIHKFHPIYYDGNFEFRRIKQTDYLNDSQFCALSSLMSEQDSLANLSRIENLLKSKLDVSSQEFIQFHYVLEKAGLKVLPHELEGLLSNSLDNVDFLRQFYVSMTASSDKRCLSWNRNVALSSKEFATRVSDLVSRYQLTKLNNQQIDINRFAYDDLTMSGIRTMFDPKTLVFSTLVGDEEFVKSHFSGFLLERDVREIKEIEGYSLYRIGGPGTIEVGEQEIIFSRMARSTQFLVESKESLKRNFGWSIVMRSEIDGTLKASENSAGRTTRNGLTGCLTFYETNFYYNDILLEDGIKCEDGINLLRSSGSIRNLIVTAADYDAVDIDFSKIFIQHLQVNSAGNDCFDISYSSVQVQDAAISNCGDKGFSIGETSVIDLSNGSIKYVYSGIAVKDGSQFNGSDISVERYSECLQTYNKKQEFFSFPIVVSIDHLNCEGVVKAVHIQSAGGL